MLTMLALAHSALATRLAADKPYDSGIAWLEPPVVTPAESVGDPPSDAIVLFDGTDLSEWNGGKGWSIEGDELRSGDSFLTTKRRFGDMQLHLEWATPNPPRNAGQRRGNSGVYLMGRYELQILDSHQNPTYFDGQAGSLYKQTPPAVNAMRPPGEWNAYDVFWTAPRFDNDGELRSPAVITLLHNGVLVLHHFELLGSTSHKRPPRYEAHPARLPFGLQNKLGHVRFRNIWVRDYKPAESVSETTKPAKPR